MLYKNLNLVTYLGLDFLFFILIFIPMLPI